MKCKIAALRRVSTFPFVPAPLRPGKAIAAAPPARAFCVYSSTDEYLSMSEIDSRPRWDLTVAQAREIQQE
ncbi:MAG TPA: hypothetical protein VGB66_10605, partial [Longimicrobium sp.]